MTRRPHARDGRIALGLARHGHGPRGGVRRLRNPPRLRSRPRSAPATMGERRQALAEPLAAQASSMCAWLRSLMRRHVDFWQVTGRVASTTRSRARAIHDPAAPQAPHSDFYLQPRAPTRTARHALRRCGPMGLRLAVPLERLAPACSTRGIRQRPARRPCSTSSCRSRRWRIYKPAPEVYAIAGAPPRPPARGESASSPPTAGTPTAARRVGLRVAWCNRSPPACPERLRRRAGIAGPVARRSCLPSSRAEPGPASAVLGRQVRVLLRVLGEGAREVEFTGSPGAHTCQMRVRRLVDELLVVRDQDGRALVALQPSESAAMASRSRWLVGSSSATRRWSCRSSASACSSRTVSPPESVARSASSAPRRRRACRPSSPGISSLRELVLLLAAAQPKAVVPGRMSPAWSWRQVADTGLVAAAVTRAGAGLERRRRWHFTQRRTCRPRSGR